MKLNLIERIGDLNPQLLRELKGRLKTRNIAIAAGISLLGQLLLLMSFYGQLPTEKPYAGTIANRYCTGKEQYYQVYECFQDFAGNFVIKWQVWWLDVFVWLSLFAIFGLLVIGTYMVVADLAQEDRRGTLNFIRLSPQSTQSILGGKLLGSPVLLYTVAALAVPLHLWTGISGGISLGLILTFYGVIAVSCLLFYSGALLFGLFSSAFSGFQPWLASGGVFIFLWVANFKPITHDPIDLLNLLSPCWMLWHLISGISGDYQSPFSYLAEEVRTWQWFSMPLGSNIISAVAFTVLNCGLLTYWIWQSLMRRFPNPTKTMLSKGQSYLLTACFETVILGLAIQKMPRWQSFPNWLSYNLNSLLVFNLLLFLCLIVALSPHRQALQDWARYRREKAAHRKLFWNPSLMKDLIWGEKSPNVMAIVLNSIVACLPLICWIIVWPQNAEKGEALFSLALMVSTIAIYGAIAQLMLFMRTQKQAVWAAGALGAAIVLPPLVFAVLSIGSAKPPFALWLFSAFPWVAIMENTAITTVCMAILGQFAILALLNMRLSRQLQQAGESATKALLADRRA